MDCPVCLEHIEKEKKLTLKCSHIFHTTCLLQIENQLCPLCRQPFNFEELGYNYKKICYGNHQYGYSPLVKDGPCRICYGYKIKKILSEIN